MIATAVSAGNDCFYCMDSHGAFATSSSSREGADRISDLIDGIKSGGSDGVDAEARRAPPRRARRAARSARLTREDVARAVDAGRNRRRHAARRADRLARSACTTEWSTGCARGRRREPRPTARALRDRRARLQRRAGHSDPALGESRAVASARSSSAASPLSQHQRTFSTARANDHWRGALGIQRERGAEPMEQRGGGRGRGAGRNAAGRTSASGHRRRARRRAASDRWPATARAPPAARCRGGNPGGGAPDSPS